MHFWLKRHEICTQIEGWIAELAKLQLTERVDRSMVLRRQYRQLREELAKLPVPPGFEDLDQPFVVPSNSSAGVAAATSVAATAAGQATGGGADVPATASVASIASTASDSTQSMSSDAYEFTPQMSATDVNSNDMENHGLG